MTTTHTGNSIDILTPTKFPSHYHENTPVNCDFTHPKIMFIVVTKVSFTISQWVYFLLEPLQPDFTDLYSRTLIQSAAKHIVASVAPANVDDIKPRGLAFFCVNCARKCVHGCRITDTVQCLCSLSVVEISVVGWHKLGSLYFFGNSASRRSGCSRCLVQIVAGDSRRCRRSGLQRHGWSMSRFIQSLVKWGWWLSNKVVARGLKCLLHDLDCCNGKCWCWFASVCCLWCKFMLLGNAGICSAWETGSATGRSVVSDGRSCCKLECCQWSAGIAASPTEVEFGCRFERNMWRTGSAANLHVFASVK